MSGERVPLEKLVKDRIKAALVEAYEAYRRREPGSMDALLVKVREFAVLKTEHLEYDFKGFGTFETVDDWAQDITLKVWQNLDRFDKDPRSTPASFYPWVHAIAFRHGVDMFKQLKKEQGEKVGFTIPVKDEFGGYEEEEQDNPEVFKSAIDIQKARDPEEVLRDTLSLIPESVQGIDRKICLMLCGKAIEPDGTVRRVTQADAARELGMTHSAIKQRVAAMYKGQAAKTAAKAAKRKQTRAEKEVERKGAVARGQAELHKRLATESIKEEEMLEATV